MLPILPDSTFIGKIYGPSGGAPIKTEYAQCYMITRFTKTKVFARQLHMVEIFKPTGNGYFNESNLGTVVIEKPMCTFGDELPFFVYRFPYNDTEHVHIRHKNMILNPIDENIVLHTLSSDSSVFVKTPWHQNK